MLRLPVVTVPRFKLLPAPRAMLPWAWMAAAVKLMSRPAVATSMPPLAPTPVPWPVTYKPATRSMRVRLLVLAPFWLVALVVVVVTFKSRPALARKLLAASICPPMLFRSFLALTVTASPVMRPPRFCRLLAVMLTRRLPATLPDTLPRLLPAMVPVLLTSPVTLMLTSLPAIRVPEPSRSPLWTLT